MNIKRCLSFLMSLIIFVEPLIASAQKPSDVAPMMQYVRDEPSVCVGGNTRVPTEAKIVFAMFAIGVAFVSSVEMAVNIGREIWFKRLCDNISKEYNTEIPGFVKTDTKGDDIKKQEGVHWCWNACLQRLLHKHDIEKTQKEIFKGITGKSYVSPFKMHRTQANFVAYTRDEFETTYKDKYKDPKLRKYLSRCVFNEEIARYVEKITDDKYTYQTLYIPWDKLCVDETFGSDSGGSICFYKICDKLKGTIVSKNQCDAGKVILKALCPIIKNSHAITIEDTKDDKFIIGEPQGGATVVLNNTEFFREKSMICDKDCREEFPHGMPISFLTEKGNETTHDEWCEIIETCRAEAQGVFLETRNTEC